MMDRYKPFQYLISKIPGIELVSYFTDIDKLKYDSNDDEDEFKEPTVQNEDK